MKQKYRRRHNITIANAGAYCLIDYRERDIAVYNVHATKPGKGFGTKLMKRLQVISNRTGRPLALSVAPYGTNKLSIKDTIKFYEKAGFSKGSVNNTYMGMFYYPKQWFKLRKKS